MPKFTESGTPVLIKWWDGPPVLFIAPCSPEPAMQLRTATEQVTLTVRVPGGPVEATALTKTQKRFLLKVGMNPAVLKSGRVFVVSEEIANSFVTDRKVSVEVAKRCGLSENALYRIMEAKIKLNAFRPANYHEKKALSGLRSRLNCEQPKKGRGRPEKVTAEERIQMHADAAELREKGMNTDKIVRILAQRYELRNSYAKRILEDAVRLAGPNTLRRRVE